MDLETSSLNNKYYAFRHGESQANVEGIIVSHPDIGTVQYGLSATGQCQVAESAERLRHLKGNAIIVASDFRRTVETAEIIRAALGVDSVRLDTRLRERFFGQWDGACYTHYSDAWKKDAVDPDQSVDGAESANMVRSRMVNVIRSLEVEFSARTIILVSHGDPLRLLQTAFEGLDTALHRTVPYFGTAECRLMNP